MTEPAAGRSRLGALIERSQDLDARAQLFVVAGGLVAVAAIGLVDLITGSDWSVSVFYLVPIVAVTLLAGRRSGVVVALASASAWLLADLNTTKYHSQAAPYWNATVRFTIFLIDVYLVAALRDALARARASERRTREFLGDAAHQLRTPVAGLRLSSEALLRERGRGDRERLLANMVTESARAGRLVASLLRITRLDEGEQVRRERCDLVPIVRTEVERFEALHPELRFRVPRANGARAGVWGDQASLGEMLASLLENAARHAVSEVAVDIENGAGSVVVRVTDDGAGVPAGAEERIFDRFVSLDGRGGSGLGLSIVRSIAEAHDGGVTYRDRSFIVTLPAARP